MQRCSGGFRLSDFFLFWDAKANGSFVSRKSAGAHVHFVVPVGNPGLRMTRLSLMELALAVAVLGEVCFPAFALFRAVPGAARRSGQIS